MNWKDIPGFEGLYKISNTGIVMSYDRTLPMGSRQRFYKGRKQTVFIGSSGYPCIGISKDKRQKQIMIHRILGILFIPNPDNKPYLNHINGIKTDFRLTNLEWCTQSENNKHAFAIGLIDTHGEGHTQSKLTNDAVLEIRSALLRDDKFYAQKFGVHPATIRDVIQHRTWTHI
jgi:hypothetical protein